MHGKEQQGLKIEVKERKDPKVMEIFLAGFIDTNTASSLEKEITQLIEKKQYDFLLNMAQVNFVSSLGWGIMVSVIDKLRQNSGKIVLCGMIAQVFDVYRMMALGHFLPHFDSEEKALQSFK